MRAHTWILGGAAGAALLGCMAGPVGAQDRNQPTLPANAPAKPPAIVNGEVITMAEFEAMLKRAGPEPAAMPEKMRKLIRMDALGSLIDDTLRHQFLHKSAAPVSKADIDKQLGEMAAMLKPQGKTLDDFYRDEHITEEELRTSIGYQMQWIAYCNARATDDVLHKYYLENKDFFDGVMVEASHIVFRVASGASEAEVKATREKLLALRTQIVEKKIDFATAAKNYSQDEAAARGGQIGVFGPRGIDPVFAKPAFALQVGQVSDVVQSGMGLHLIKVTDRKPGTPSDFKTVKDKVKMLFTDDLDTAVITDLRRTAKIEINLP